MRVKGIEIPQAVIDAAVARMRESSFTLSSVASVIARKFTGKEAGVDFYKRLEVFNRTANRIIQAHRKAGRIKQVKRGVWRWVEESEASGAP